MGKTLTIKLSVLIVIFLVTCIAVYGFNPSGAQIKKPPLADFLGRIDGHRTVRHLSLPANVFRMLKLDDYAYCDFTGDEGTVNLYIGYYYSSSKAYAAHSPTVCYPSQGWKIERRPAASTLAIAPHDIHYEEIVTSYGDEKELVLYWYQARLFTNTQVYRNKIDMGYNKLMNNDEQHGFVRVAVPFQNRPYATVKKAAVDFIQAFYPQFVRFITEGA